MLVSACYVGFEKYDKKEILHLLKDAGFEAVDYQLCDWIDYAKEGADLEGFLSKASDFYKDIKAEADKIGLTIGQVHAPFPSQRVGDKTFNERMLKLVIKSIEVASILDSPCIVIHPIIPTNRLYDDFKQETKQINMDFYAELIPYLRQYKVKLAVENMWQRDRFNSVVKIVPTVCSTAEEMIDYIDSINQMAGEEIACACFDIGHSELLGYQPWDIIKQLGSKLKVLHVHDVSYNDDTHTLPFFGQVSWDRTMKALKEINYSGTLNFEVQKPINMFPIELYPDVMKLLSAIGHYFVENYGL